MKRWNDLFADILLILKEKLAPYLTYHSWEHTVYVVDMVEQIAKKEFSSEYNIVLMKTAALFHDYGFINQDVDDNKTESIRLVQETLPNYGYTENEIDQIIGMINATRIPQKPKNKFECIVADANLEYLGSENFIEIGNRLFKELKHFTPSLSLEEFDDIQIKFLQSHQYHTDYCLKFKSKAKEINLQLLLEKQ